MTFEETVKDEINKAITYAKRQAKYNREMEMFDIARGWEYKIEACEEILERLKL